MSKKNRTRSARDHAATAAAPGFSAPEKASNPGDATGETPIWRFGADEPEMAAVLAGRRLNVRTATGLRYLARLLGVAARAKGGPR